MRAQKAFDDSKLRSIIPAMSYYQDAMRLRTKHPFMLEIDQINKLFACAPFHSTSPLGSLVKCTFGNLQRFVFICDQSVQMPKECKKPNQVNENGQNPSLNAKDPEQPTGRCSTNTFNSRYNDES